MTGKNVFVTLHPQPVTPFMVEIPKSALPAKVLNDKAAWSGGVVKNPPPPQMSSPRFNKPPAPAAAAAARAAEKKLVPASPAKEKLTVKELMEANAKLQRDLEVQRKFAEEALLHRRRHDDDEVTDGEDEDAKSEGDGDGEAGGSTPGGPLTSLRAAQRQLRAAKVTFAKAWVARSKTNKKGQLITPRGRPPKAVTEAKEALEKAEEEVAAAEKEAEKYKKNVKAVKKRARSDSEEL